MKLRIRNQQTKQTLKLEIPNNSTFQLLKNEISRCIYSPSSSSSSSGSVAVAVSLNGIDEIVGAPDEFLQSLGITSGDLLFYSIVEQQQQALVLDEHNFGGIAQTLVLGEHDFGGYESLTLSSSELAENAKSDVGLIGFRDSVTLGTEIQSETRTLASGVQNLGESQTRDCDKAVIVSDTVEKEQSFVSDDMDEDEDDADADVDQFENDELMAEIGSSSDMMEKNFTAPCFLRKVLRDELSDTGSPHRLLVIALHAVLLDSGFVQFDPMSNTKLNGFQTPHEWPSMSIWYTLPGLIDNGSEIIDSVFFKLHSIGYYTIVYGSLTRNGSQVHTVRLNEQRFAPTIDKMWAGKSDSINQKSDSISHSEREVFEFWKMVKDHLVLPLLIDLCNRVGYELPPCLMQLPTDLKFMILELLPGVEIAKVACVCSELRYLSSNDDLWKRKYIEQFGDKNLKSGQSASPWKTQFVLMWNRRKECETTTGYFFCRPRFRNRRPRQDIRRLPEPFGFPRIIGGDHDLMPDFGIRHGGIAGIPIPRRGIREVLFPISNRRRIGPP